jgi:glycosyltransferase involved in cell wall biosynthesis
MNQMVSVIITNYNYEKYVGHAIESVIRQDYRNKEIIVVDDGSTDNSIEIISKFEKNIIFIRKPNGGISSARNAGYLAANGFYISYLDADDYWEPSKLTKQVVSLQISKNQLTYCRMNIFQEENELQQVSVESREGDFRSIFQNEPGCTPFPPSSVMMTKKLARLVGEWDVDLFRAAEDYDYYRRCSLFTKFSFVNESLVWHREHSKSLSNSPLENHYRENLIAVFKMLNDTKAPVQFIQRRRAIFRFQISYGKAFIKNWQLLRSIKALLVALFPLKIIMIVSKRN